MAVTAATALAGLTLADVTLDPVHADEFPPRKPVTLMVGFAAGGAADAAARLIAKKLTDNIGQSVVIDNKPGAGGNIAHQIIAGMPGDGATLLFGSVGPLTIAPHLMKLRYDPFKDLAPVSGGVNFPNILVVHQGLGVKTLAQFVELAKKQSIDFASTGAGSASHLAGELFNQRAGVDMVHVPYKGGAPALQDLLGERIASYFAAPPTALPYIEVGRLIPLATTGLTRPDYLPDIPTIAESGYPEFEALNWYAFLAPASTPAAILDRWNVEIVKVLEDPEVSASLAKHGLTPQPTTRDGLASFMRKESVQWKAIIQERQVTAN